MPLYRAENGRSGFSEVREGGKPSPGSMALVGRDEEFDLALVEGNDIPATVFEGGADLGIGAIGRMKALGRPLCVAGAEGAEIEAGGGAAQLVQGGGVSGAVAGSVKRVEAADIDGGIEGTFEGAEFEQIGAAELDGEVAPGGFFACALDGILRNVDPQNTMATAGQIDGGTAWTAAAIEDIVPEEALPFELNDPFIGGVDIEGGITRLVCSFPKVAQVFAINEAPP